MSFSNIVNARDLKKIISWVTCYDYSFACAIQESKVDMVLVGDSASMVVLGEKTTSPATMEQMIIFAKAVRKGAPNKIVVGDLPRGSYESSDLSAVDNAMRFCKEGECDAVKLEGGLRMASRVKSIVDAGIPVIGHIGLTPQSLVQFGGYRVTGRSTKEVEWLISEAKALEDAGAVAILIEATPPETSQVIRDSVKIPIFGIGAGGNLDGQLLILHDLLGLYPIFRPKFAKNYIVEVVSYFAEELKKNSDVLQYGRETRRDGLFELSLKALNLYADEVSTKKFPSYEYLYK